MKHCSVWCVMVPCRLTSALSLLLYFLCGWNTRVFNCKFSSVYYLWLRTKLVRCRLLTIPMCFSLCRVPINQTAVRGLHSAEPSLFLASAFGPHPFCGGQATARAHFDLHSFYLRGTKGHFGNTGCSESCCYCWFRRRF